MAPVTAAVFTLIQLSLKPLSVVRPSLYFSTIECGETRELTLDEEKVVDAFRYFAFLTFLAFWL